MAVGSEHLVYCGEKGAYEKGICLLATGHDGGLYLMATANWYLTLLQLGGGSFGGCGEGSIRVESGKDFWPLNGHMHCEMGMQSRAL